jgi:hypothetical protein
MTYVDDLKTGTHDDIKALATRHGAFESFMQDLERLGEKAWHNARSQGHDPASIVGDVEKTVSELEQDVTDAEQALAEAKTRLETAKNEPEPADPVSTTPADDGAQVSQPAEPASPVSDAGFPTSNVDVAQESHPA